MTIAETSLSHDPRFALLRSGPRNNQRTFASMRLFGSFLGFPQRAETQHIPTDFRGPPLQIGHCLRAFFPSQTLAVGARNTFRGRIGRLLVSHSHPGPEQVMPAQSEDRAGNTAISVHL
jgi:hypothetical protein